MDGKAVAFCCLSCAASDLNFYMLIPFFPAVAKAKKLPNIWVGAIFAQTQLAALFTTPFVAYLNR